MRPKGGASVPTLIQIGLGKEEVRAIAENILKVLNSRGSASLKEAAVKHLVEAYTPRNVTISNCNFTVESRSSKGKAQV